MTVKKGFVLVYGSRGIESITSGKRDNRQRKQGSRNWMVTLSPSHKRRREGGGEEDVGQGYKPSKPAPSGPSDAFPPTRLRLLKGPSLAQTAPPARGQLFKYMNL